MPDNASPGADPVRARADVFGVRVGGAPVADLEALRCERAWAAAEEVVALAQWLRDEGTALSDLLHEVIGDRADDDRSLLVALRRAVFRGRRPTGRVWAARRALPGDLRVRVERWARESERAAELTARVPSRLAADRAAAREALRVAARRDAFRFALALGSPDLSAAVRRWLDDPAAPTPRARTLAGLAKYLARAVGKPTPYGSFALSGLGRWGSGGAPARLSGDLAWCGVPELDRAAVLELWSGLTGPLREHVGLRVNPSVEREGGRLRFLGAGAGEPVVSVAESGATREVLHFVRTAPDPTVGSLTRRLADPGADGYVAGLLDLGLLEALRPFPDRSGDPLDHLARWVDAHAPGSPWPRRLRDLRSAVVGYGGLTTAAERAERLRQVRSTLDGLLVDLGRAPWRPRRAVLLENAVLPRPVVECSRDRWRPVLDDLEAVRGFLGALDRSLPVKQRLAAFFRDRYDPGARVSFLRLYREYRTCPDPGDAPPADLGRSVVAGLYGDDARDTVSVDPQVLAKLAASWPAHVRAPRSVCCYGQELPGPGGPRFVLNAVRTGYGWGITRIEHLLDAAGHPTPVRTPAEDGPDVVLAECRAAFRSQLNQRVPAVPHAIDYPGGERPDGCSLSLPDLHVRHDRTGDRLLLCDGRGREVRPLALGLLAAALLPPALRFLVAAFGEPQTALAPVPHWDDVGWRPAVDGVRRRPRLEVGRVVLARAGWRVPAADVPSPAKGRSDADFLLALARWRARHGIPRRCFVRATGRRDPARKPVFVDFADWFLLPSLPRHGDADVVFEEALPDPADAPWHGEHGQRVTEYVFELTATDRHG
ncbi:lantibiotic dehydratase [Actinosynnema sp. NPDC059335]|uniref:lantibiotic dehydratase n=1 Tax=Actinosynnema sp. NPDC059335 TaxID=3346804 RepID=UPI003673260A